VTPAIGLDGTDQPIDLGAGQVLYSAFRFRLGVVTVRFTVAGATNFKGDFVMVFSAPAMPTVHISYFANSSNLDDQPDPVLFLKFGGSAISL
jgi:hypothetical protein